MSTHAFDDRAKVGGHSRLHVSPHVIWLAGGFVLAFAMPFVLTDVLGLNRDIFYGI